MNIALLLFAIIIPWVATAAWLEYAFTRGSQSAAPGRALLYGSAYLLGMMGTVGLLYASEKLTGTFQFAWILNAWSIALLAAWHLTSQWKWLVRPGSKWPGINISWTWMVAAIALLLIGIRFIGLSLENTHQAMPAWDAWVVWAERAKLWFHTGHINNFVHGQNWLTSTDADLYTIDAAHYPMTVSLIHLWAALALGEWHEAWVNLPWLGAAIAITLVLYGALKSTGAPDWVAMLGSWILVSLPIFNTHIALAGYADLWLTLSFTTAVLGLMVWIRNRERSALALATLALLTMPFMKHQAWLLLLACIVPAIIWAIPGKARWASIAAISVLLTTSLVIFDGQIPLGQYGTLGFKDYQLTLPGMGIIAPEFARIALTIRQHFFVLDSWHMLWGVGTISYLVMLAKGWRTSMVQALILTLTSAIVFYSLSYASPRVLPFVIDGTVINRGLLYLAPLIVFAIIQTLLLMDERDIRNHRPISTGQNKTC